MAFDILSFAIGKAAGNSGGGGGSVEGVHFVTFMSEDGSTELYKRPVADGDDCADPVERGLISEPTKESTAQYSYTLVGWSATANGALDENILKAVTADKTVYANFAAVLRYYTVTYYDEDGTTVLKTGSLAYGATPSYVPTKSGYDFVAWTPNATVTGDMSYTATWKAKPTFETATWAEIAEVCAAGNAASTFAIGNSKPVTLTYSDGTSETINFRIVDMGVDTLEDGTASLTIMADNMVKNTTQLASKYNNGDKTFYKNDTVKTFLEDIFNALPEDLQAVIKPYYWSDGWFVTVRTNIFVPNAVNLNIGGLGEWGTTPTILGYEGAYQYFANGASIQRTKLSDSSYDDYWTSTMIQTGSGGNYTKYYYLTVDGLDKASTLTNANGNYYGIVPCFCI